MRERLVGCLWYLIGLPLAAAWIIANIVPNKFVNVLANVLLVVGSVVFLWWEYRRIINRARNKVNKKK